MRAVPLAAQGEHALTWIGTGTDIEDQKRSEEAIRQQQKLDSIGLLAGGIAHDFNNLLVGILGGATCMLDTVGPDHPARPMLDMVVRAGERAAELTRQLLAYSGKREVFVELVDIARVLKDTCELVRASMPKNVQLRWKADDIPRIQASPAQMQQLVMNLVINAAEAIGEQNGVVSVDARLADVPSRAVANILGYEIAPGEYIELIVADTGCGMTEEVRGKSSILSLRPSLQAAVWVLPRCRALSGPWGAIEVSSTIGHGSTFRLLLPARRSERARADEGRSAKQQTPAVILVIDDEEIVRRTMQHALEHAGHRVYSAADGPGGLRLFTQHREEIDLVLLDMSMPQMPGDHVLRELRKIAPGVRVAIISGYSEQEVAAHFEEAPAGYIQKPFTSQTVEAAVTKLLQANRDREISRHAGEGLFFLPGGPFWVRGGNVFVVSSHEAFRSASRANEGSLNVETLENHNNIRARSVRLSYPRPKRVCCKIPPEGSRGRLRQTPATGNWTQSAFVPCQNAFGPALGLYGAGGINGALGGLVTGQASSATL